MRLTNRVIGFSVRNLSRENRVALLPLCQIIPNIRAVLWNKAPICCGILHDVINFIHLSGYPIIQLMCMTGEVCAEIRILLAISGNVNTFCSLNWKHTGQLILFVNNLCFNYMQLVSETWVMLYSKSKFKLNYLTIIFSLVDD